MPKRTTRILILCKTYPTPSRGYVETSCVAGMEEDGTPIRLFPVPFRLLGEDQQFKKWQWITALVERAPNDRRLESHRIYVDTIKTGDEVKAARDWSGRRVFIDRLPTFNTFEALEAARQEKGITIGLLRPVSILDLEIKEARQRDWTEEELEKLLQQQRQGNLFDEERKTVKQLQKIPYDFHYRYQCGVEVNRHKINDWEASALYRNLVHSYGEDHWQSPFKEQLLTRFQQKDVMFLMGTMHRFPDQWLIISLIYPPKQLQASLF